MYLRSVGGCSHRLRLGLPYISRPIPLRLGHSLLSGRVLYYHDGPAAASFGSSGLAIAHALAS
jgi:hypothetical protein